MIFVSSVFNRLSCIFNGFKWVLSTCASMQPTPSQLSGPGKKSVLWLWNKHEQPTD